MPTLIIHAPYSQAQENQKKSFSETVATHRAEGYAISSHLFGRLSPGDPVIVICKVHEKQAIGRIKELIPTEKAGNGMQRYDVIMEGLRPVPCTHIGTRLTRNGIAVI